MKINKTKDDIDIEGILMAYIGKEEFKILFRKDLIHQVVSAMEEYEEECEKLKN
jgi:23S rRNA maturation mini-RNase III